MVAQPQGTSPSYKSYCSFTIVLFWKLIWEVMGFVVHGWARNKKHQFYFRTVAMAGTPSEEAIGLLRRLLGSPELLNSLVNQEASGNTINPVNNDNNEISVLFRPNQCLNVNMSNNPQPSAAQQARAPRFEARRFSNWGGPKSKRRWVTFILLLLFHYYSST